MLVSCINTQSSLLDFVYYTLTIHNENQDIAYSMENIQRIFVKQGVMHIQHKNFEKVLFIFRKGNENLIPLNTLCNQRLFFLLLTRYFGDFFRNEGE